MKIKEVKELERLRMLRQLWQRWSWTIRLLRLRIHLRLRPLVAT